MVLLIFLREAGEGEYFLSPNRWWVTQLLIFKSPLKKSKLPPSRVVIRAKECLLPLPSGNAGQSNPLRAGPSAVNTTFPREQRQTSRPHSLAAGVFQGQVPWPSQRPPPPPLASASSLLLPYQGVVTLQDLSHSRFNREVKGVTTPSDWHAAEAATSLASGIPSHL